MAMGATGKLLGGKLTWGTMQGAEPLGRSKGVPKADAFSVLKLE